MQTIPCELCSSLTMMLATKRCDECWELERRVFENPALVRKLLGIAPPEPDRNWLGEALPVVLMPVQISVLMRVHYDLSFRVSRLESAVLRLLDFGLIRADPERERELISAGNNPWPWATTHRGIDMVDALCHVPLPHRGPE